MEEKSAPIACSSDARAYATVIANMLLEIKFTIISLCYAKIDSDYG